MKAGAVSRVPHADRKVVDTVFEGLFVKALGLEVTPALRRRLAELGVDFQVGLKPMYPHAVWEAALIAAAEELMPGKPLPEALHALGGRAVVGYFDTFIGRALKQVLRAIGVKRTLARMSLNFSATNNYTETEMKELGERHYELWMNELSLTQHNMAGIIETGLGIAGGKNVRVEIVRSDGSGCTYDIRWETTS